MFPVNTGGAVVFSVMLTLMSNASAQDQFDLVDPFVDAVLRQLAVNQKFNRINSPDQEAVKFGASYYVDSDEVSCFRQLRHAAAAGNPISVVNFDEFDATNLPKPRVIKEWRSIKISSLLTRGVLGELNAKFPGRNAEVSAAADSFIKTNAQIMFASVSVPQLPYQRAAQAKLKMEAIGDIEDVAPGASGVITPVSILVVQKFEFDKELVQKARFSLAAKFMELFGLKIASEQSRHLVGRFDNPTNSTLAFTPALVQFKNINCN